MSEKIFEKQFSVRWSDLDPNGHMRHSVYADLCAAARVHYLESIGFGMQQFAQLQIGPILFNENLTYKKEVRANDTLSVDISLAAYSDDGRKWKIRHSIKRKDPEETCAVVEVFGAWFSTSQRKVVRPPGDLIKTMEALPKTEDFELIE